MRRHLPLTAVAAKGASGISTYSKRSGVWSCISAVRQGRAAAGRSRLAGWPVPRCCGGLLRGFLTVRMSWSRTRVVPGGEVHHAVEHHAATARVAAVEPETNSFR